MDCSSPSSLLMIEPKFKHWPWTRQRAVDVILSWLRVNVSFPNLSHTHPHSSPSQSTLTSWRPGQHIWLSSHGEVSSFRRLKPHMSTGCAVLGGQGRGYKVRNQPLLIMSRMQGWELGSGRWGLLWWQDLPRSVYEHISCHLGPVPSPGLLSGEPYQVTHVHLWCFPGQHV